MITKNVNEELIASKKDLDKSIKLKKTLKYAIFPYVEKRSHQERGFSGIVKLFIFYFILYTFLFSMTTGFLIIAGQLIWSDDVPFLTGNQSLIGFEPGLGFRPMINFKIALIAFDPSDPQTWLPYVINLRTFLDYYQDPNLDPLESFATCENGFKTPDDPNLPCKFLPVDLGPCIKQNNYGYDRFQPCIIVKMNRVYGWVPDILNKTRSPYPLLRCYGQNIQDTEVLGSLRYYPNVTTADGEVLGYYSPLYFPYLVQVSYRNPLIAVQLVQPRRHVVLMVQCDIENVRNPGSSVKFEVLVD